MTIKVKNHDGYDHGLRPGETYDMNCPSCQREQAAERIESALRMADNEPGFQSDRIAELVAAVRRELPAILGRPLASPSLTLTVTISRPGILSEADVCDDMTRVLSGQGYTNVRTELAGEGTR